MAVRIRPEFETKPFEEQPRLLKISEIPTGQAVLKLPRKTTTLTTISNAGYNRCFFIAQTSRSVREVFGASYQDVKEIADPILERAKQIYPLLSKHLKLAMKIDVSFGSWGFGTKPTYFYAADLKGLLTQLQHVNFDHIPLRTFILPNDECQWLVFQPRGDSFTAIQFGQKMYEEIPVQKLMDMVDKDTKLQSLGGYVCAMKTATYKGITCEPIKKTPAK